MSPSWPATVLCPHRAGEVPSGNQDMLIDIHLSMDQERVRAVDTCLCWLPAACDAMDGTKGGLLMAAIPVSWSRVAGVATSSVSIEKYQTCDPKAKGSWS